MGIATLGGVQFHTGPDEVRWDYRMKTSETQTLGGKVIQILGVTLGDMTVHGRFGGERAKGDTEGWQEQIRWHERIERWSRQAANQQDPTALRFSYPPRNWDFDVYIKATSGITHAVTEIAPEFTLTLFVLEEGAKTIVKDIKDLYLQRLMEGVGWKQTEYNGPSEEYVQSLLGDGTVRDYYNSLAQDAFNSGLPGGGL